MAARRVVVIFGAGGAVWRDKMEPALRKINERIPLEVLAIDRGDPRNGVSPLIKHWLSANDPQDLRRLADSLNEVSVAIIATWNETHVPLLLYLLGKVPVVLVEKPLADGLEMGRLALPFVDAAAATTTCRCIDHYLAKPSVRYVLDLARRGELGDLIGDLKLVRFSMREARTIEPGREHLLRGVSFRTCSFTASR